MAPRRILVIANETCAARGVVEEVRYRAGPGEAEVLVIAPALARSRLEHWLTADLERRQEEARTRLETSIAGLRAAGLSARGELGDPDPLQALDDSLRIFEPDEVVISTHPHARSNWLERQVVARARQRYPVPITHVVVDIERESAIPLRDDRLRAGRAPEARLRVFHRTGYEAALEIAATGFRDRRADDGSAGVWVTDRPPGHAGEQDQVLFAIDLPESAARAFERDGEGPGRRFLLPAELLNRHGPPITEGDWSE